MPPLIFACLATRIHARTAPSYDHYALFSLGSTLLEGFLERHAAQQTGEGGEEEDDVPVLAAISQDDVDGGSLEATTATAVVVGPEAGGGAAGMGTGGAGGDGSEGDGKGPDPLAILAKYADNSTLRSTFQTSALVEVDEDRGITAHLIDNPGKLTLTFQIQADLVGVIEDASALLKLANS